MRIGLLGGSFNPAHEAHRAVSLLAWKRLALDRIWWLVSPGNPLKDIRDLPPLANRVARACAVAASPFIDVSDIEAVLGTRYTVDTIARLRKRYPGVRFVFLMGADNLAQFSRWKRWRELAGLVPIAVIDRQDCSFSALASPAAAAFRHARIGERKASSLALHKPPAWVFLHGFRSSLSSTILRRAAGARIKG